MNPTLTGGGSPGQHPLLSPKTIQTSPQSLSFAGQAAISRRPAYPIPPKALRGDFVPIRRKKRP